MKIFNSNISKFILILLIILISSLTIYFINGPSKFQEQPIETTKILETKCNNYCSLNDQASFYELKFNSSNFLYDCRCLNSSKTILEVDPYTPKEIDELEQLQKEDQFILVKGPHWTHLPVTYFITNKQECGSYEANKINRAFSELETATNKVITFKEINSSADIDVTCSFIEDCYNKTIDIREDLGIIYKYETICEHNKGSAQITEFKDDMILKATIEVFGLAGFSETERLGMSGFYIGSCGYTTTEIHEILHTFGYGHFDNLESIMYHEEDSIGYTIQEEGECKGKKKVIDEVIINNLVDTYG